MEPKIAHLQIIQGIITRMANHSFLLKGWTVTLVAALFALGTKDDNGFFIYMALFPAVIFWWLDGYYLYIERQFKALYDEVRLKTPNEIDYSLEREHINSKHVSWLGSVFSTTPILFYGGIIGFIIIMMIFLQIY